MAFAALALTALFVPGRAEAAAIRPGPWSANAGASLVKANVSLTGALSVADLDITTTSASGDTTATPRSAASAHNTGTLALLNQNVDLSTVLSSASQTAPPEQAAADQHTLIPVPASPLVDAGVSNASARARWAGDAECVAADVPVARGFQDLAHLLALSTGGNTVLGVNNSQQGVSYTTSTVSLPSNGLPNDGRDVRAETTTQVAGLDVLTVGAAAPLVHVAAVGPYTATATATGIPGTASTSSADPVVDLSIAGQPVLTLLAGQNPVDVSLTVPTGLPTVDALLKQLAPLLDPLAQVIRVQVPPVVRSTSSDGTQASISGALLKVTVLGALGVPLGSVTLAPFSAVATAPAGGLQCGPAANPVKIGKSASKAEVTPGESFSYDVTFTNTDPTCTLTNTKLTDVITGPVGSTVTGTNPTGGLAPPDGTIAGTSGVTVTWDAATVGDIAPGQTKTFTITVKTSDTAVAGDSFDDTATGEGDCGGVRYTTPFTLNDIPKIVTALLARTGGDSTLPIIGAFALALAALGFRRLRRA